MPHITLAFPFVADTNFKQASELLQAEMAGMQPFPVAINGDTISAFDHGPKWTAIVRPDGEAYDALHRLEDVIVHLFPN